MHPRTKPCVVLALLCACGLSGCRFTLLSGSVWETIDPLGRTADTEQTAAASTKPPPKTIPIEMVFVRTEQGDDQLREELWQFADEQGLDDELRRRLAANGLRAGVIAGPLPPTLAARFQPQATAAAAGELPEPPSARPAVVRRILRLLPGRKNEIVATTGLAELVLLEHDGEAVHGGTYRDATAQFTLRSWPAADGRVRLELTPTIKHGPLERSWVGEEGVFRMETGQREHALDRLRFEVTIPANATLFVGCAGDGTSTAGDAFFRDRSGGQPTLRLLSIHPQARTVDPLFAHDSTGLEVEAR